MSRSYLHDKEILKRFSFMHPLGKNPHKRDEMPKNHVSNHPSSCQRGNSATNQRTNVGSY